jgi:hypothetical protein
MIEIGGIFALVVGGLSAMLGIAVPIKLPVWTGWTKLAEKYPIKVPYAGSWQRWKSVRVNFYTQLFKIATTKEALYFVPEDHLYWLRLWSPIQIPWTAISNVEKKGHWLVLDIDDVSIKLPQQSIPEGLLAKINVK